MGSTSLPFLTEEMPHWGLLESSSMKDPPPDLATLPSSAILTTREAAALAKSQQTLRKLYCLQGHAYGIAPLKLGARLGWRAGDLKKLLGLGE